jgi:hypothetical protein
VSEPPEQPKPGKEKNILFATAMVFVMIVVPLLFIIYVAYKLSQIH